jgi:hypothetical protein
MRPSSRVLTIAVMLALAWGGGGSTALVLAQEDTTGLVATPPPGTDTEEPPVVMLQTDDPTAIEINEVLATTIVIILLLIVLFALVELIRYLRESRASYYGIVGEFARKGVFFAPSYVSATAEVPGMGLRAVPGEEATTVQQHFRVDGPGFALAGQAAVLNAFLDNSPADGTTWTLRRPDGTAVPADVATIQPETGPATTFTSATPGQYRIDVTAPGGTQPAVQTSITVLEPPAKDGAMPLLPFVGQGYGSIIGGLVLIALVGALAAIRAIDADIIGVLLGSLAGFFFGVNTAARS